MYRRCRMIGLACVFIRIWNEACRSLINLDVVCELPSICCTLFFREGTTLDPGFSSLEILQASMIKDMHTSLTMNDGRPATRVHVYNTLQLEPQKLAREKQTWRKHEDNVNVSKQAQLGQ